VENKRAVELGESRNDGKIKRGSGILELGFSNGIPQPDLATSQAGSRSNNQLVTRMPALRAKLQACERVRGETENNNYFLESAGMTEGVFFNLTKIKYLHARN